MTTIDRDLNLSLDDAVPAPTRLRPNRVAYVVMIAGDGLYGWSCAPTFSVQGAAEQGFNYGSPIKVVYADA